jgi:hypothetical protein
MPPGGGRGGLSIIVAPTTSVAGPTVNTAIATVIQQNVAATIAVINSRASSAQALWLPWQIKQPLFKFVRRVKPLFLFISVPLIENDITQTQNPYFR